MKHLYSFLFFSLITLFGCARINPPTNIQASTQQVIIVNPKNTTQATLTGWQLINNHWQLKFGPWPAVIGRTGIAKAGEKREGDGKTPSGTFDIPFAFGKLPVEKTHLIYKQATDNDFWVDDPNAATYNQWVNGKPNAQSYEVLNRPDGLYRQALVLGYNLDPIKAGDGSAIFLHRWRTYYKPTAGCVALNQRHVRKLFEWLDQNLHPQIIIHEN